MKPSVFAQFAAVGAWTDGSICESCGELIGGERAEPLQTEWEDGTDRIGSFSWSSYTCAVTDDVRQFLVERGVDCLFGRVEVMRPTRKTRRLRVPFPYTGPNLHWLMPTRRVPLNEARSSIKLVSDCPQCGQKRYTFKREGLMIDAAEIGNTSLFLIDQFGKSDATFVTEPLLSGLKSQGFTNLSPRLAGEIR